MEKIEPRLKPKKPKKPKKQKKQNADAPQSPAQGILRPSPYPMLFDPKILWEKIEPYARNPRLFDELRKTRIKPEIEDGFARQAVKGLSEEGLRQWMELGGDGVRLMPRVFTVVRNPVAPVKYTPDLFLEVEDEMRKNGGKIGEALQTVFGRHFDEEQGDSLKGFEKQFRAWVKKGRSIP